MHAVPLKLHGYVVTFIGWTMHVQTDQQCLFSGYFLVENNNWTTFECYCTINTYIHTCGGYAQMTPTILDMH